MAWKHPNWLSRPSGNGSQDDRIGDSGSAVGALRAILIETLRSAGDADGLRLNPAGLTVVLIVGVNGSGKTTTIAKLAQYLRGRNSRVMLAAADTFRAAAEDQLKIWAGRVGVPVVSHQPGADPGAVVFDALESAQARGYDVLLVDTAGRLHTKSNLMDELAKIRRVIGRRDSRGSARDAAGAGRDYRAERSSSRPASSCNRPASPALCWRSSTAPPRVGSSSRSPVS